MKPKAKSQFDTFTAALKRVLQVPHSELKAKLDAEKAAKRRKARKKSSASRVSGE